MSSNKIHNSIFVTVVAVACSAIASLASWQLISGSLAAILQVAVSIFVVTYLKKEGLIAILYIVLTIALAAVLQLFGHAWLWIPAFFVATGAALQVSWGSEAQCSNAE
jgi:uncharacterized membrane protein YGL010W